MRRTTVKDILAQEHSGGDFLLQGWVKTRRTSKNLSFIHLNDGSTHKGHPDRGRPVAAQL